MSLTVSRPEHGRFMLARNGSVICIRAFEQWNEEATVHFVEEFRRLASPLTDSGWAVLTDLREWQLGVPEMERHMNALDLWCLYHGQSAEAAVLPENPAIRWQLEKMFVDTQGDIDREYFEDPLAAATWLLGQGQRLDREALARFLELGAVPDADPPR